MKTLLALAALAMLSGTAQAQNTYRTMPNGLGGSTTYGSDGSIYRTMPNGLGGSTTYETPGYDAPQYNRGPYLGPNLGITNPFGR